MSFVPHTKFPTVKTVRLATSGTWLEGNYDFSKTFDPFETYLRDYEKSPLLDLINTDASVDGALQFTRRWGPLRFDESCSEDVFINEQIYRLSHKRSLGWLPPISDMPKPGFRVGIEEFLEEQRKVKHLHLLWSAVRQSDYEKMRDLLKDWPETVWRVTTLREVFEADAAWLQNQVRKGTPESLTRASAECLHEICLRWVGLGNPLEPCLEPVEERSAVIGFRFVQHVRSLIDAIYFMVWLDLSKGQALIDCANCGTAFLARKRNQIYCSPHCTWAANSRRSYERRATKKMKER
jgi:hypothetical protein